ncbi:unnamed protein product [Withania somnifera]
MSLFDTEKTFRPKRSAPSGSTVRIYGNLREAVRLPSAECLHEWLAVNTVDFFNQVNILYGTLTEFCTPLSCPTMSAGPKYEYHWADGANIKKPIEVSAPKYVDYLMGWIETQLDDESICPQNLGCCEDNIYHSHFQKIISLKEEAHMNTCFKHFVLFIWEFHLIDKSELAPLSELVESILQL